jgi:hypothetical protein
MLLKANVNAVRKQSFHGWRFTFVVGFRIHGVLICLDEYCLASPSSSSRDLQGIFVKDWVYS